MAQLSNNGIVRTNNSKLYFGKILGACLSSPPACHRSFSRQPSAKTYGVGRGKSRSANKAENAINLI